MARAALALFVLLIAASLPAAAGLKTRLYDQSRSDQRALELLDDWVKAVGAHEPGRLDAAVLGIAGWDRDSLLRVRPYVRHYVDVLGATWRLRRMPRASLWEVDAAVVAASAVATSQEHANDFIKRAALLHTDVVLLAQLVPGVVPPPKPRSGQSRLEREEEQPLVIARGPDGRFSNFELGNLNWDYARDLLDAVTPAPANDATVALWYRAITAGFAAAYSFGEAYPHIQRARWLLPDDPGVLFGDAAIQETLASPRIQDFIRVTTLPNGQNFIFVSSEREHLERAESMLRRALLRDPAFAEARVRLGRVLSQRGQHEAALAELNAVPPQADTVLTYFLHIVRGDAHRALGRLDAAERSYRQALELFPKAQSARLALGHLARMRSDREGALDLLQPSLTAATPRDDDPWWEYHRGDGRNIDSLFRQLRAPFVTKAPQ
jgi:tetratricopeptide (TPR) repeat protein